MKKSIFLITIIILGFLSAFSQNHKHIIGISSGITFPLKNTIYIDYDQFSTWPDSKINPTYSIFYEYGTSDYFKLGLNFNFENIGIEITYPIEDDFKANKFSFGLHWIGQYPKTILHAELGGFMNFAYASSDSWDANLKGLEYGILIGPAVSIKKFKIALHFQPTFAYLSSKDLPEDALLMFPRIMLKLGYTLN